MSFLWVFGFIFSGNLFVMFIVFDVISNIVYKIVGNDIVIIGIKESCLWKYDLFFLINNYSILEL